MTIVVQQYMYSQNVDCEFDVRGSVHCSTILTENPNQM